MFCSLCCPIWSDINDDILIEQFLACYSLYDLFIFGICCFAIANIVFVLCLLNFVVIAFKLTNLFFNELRFLYLPNHFYKNIGSQFAHSVVWCSFLGKMDNMLITYCHTSIGIVLFLLDILGIHHFQFSLAIHFEWNYWTFEALFCFH